MAMSPEKRAEQGERARKMWAERKAKKLNSTPPERGKFDPKEEQQPANQPPPSPAKVNGVQPPQIIVEVDWDNLPIEVAQSAFSILQKHVEYAGKVLNARTTRRPDKECWNCHKPMPDGKEAFKDDGYHDPKSGLIIPIRCCSEVCYIKYSEMRIRERRDKFIDQKRVQSQPA
jgi:hypothetical protein